MRLLLVLIFLIAIASPAMAVINITPIDKGSSWIQWEWNAGLNASEILVDGVAICGYETTNNSIIRSGFDPDSLHSIAVFTTTDNGFNSTKTLAGNWTVAPTATPVQGIPNMPVARASSQQIGWNNIPWWVFALIGVIVILLIASSRGRRR